MQSPQAPSFPLRKTFRWEIALALSLKIMLLAGLWFVMFRWDPESRPKAVDINGVFAPSPEAITPNKSLPIPNQQQEPPHVR